MISCFQNLARWFMFTPMIEDYPEPTDAEIELELGSDPKRPTLEAITAMRERLKTLRAEAKRFSKAANRFPERSEEFAADLARIRRRIAETEEKLQNYLAQYKARN